jgi:hypothetical protein
MRDLAMSMESERTELQLSSARSMQRREGAKQAIFVDAVAVLGAIGAIAKIRGGICKVKALTNRRGVVLWCWTLAAFVRSQVWALSTSSTFGSCQSVPEKSSASLTFDAPLPSQSTDQAAGAVASNVTPLQALAPPGCSTLNR